MLMQNPVQDFTEKQVTSSKQEMQVDKPWVAFCCMGAQHSPAGCVDSSAVSMVGLGPWGTPDMAGTGGRRQSPVGQVQNQKRSSCIPESPPEKQSASSSIRSLC